MPEYLTPGVYIEETSFRSKSIQGVPTATFGMAGLTRYGPVPYQLSNPPVAMTPKPTLVTSLTEFERAFGDLQPIGTFADQPNYLAFAARAFFDNGGQRLYVSRVFPFHRDGDQNILVAQDFAALPVGTSPVATWRARWPGEVGKAISIKVEFVRSKNVLVTPPAGTVPPGPVLRGVAPGAAVELFATDNDIPKDTRPPTAPKPAKVCTVSRRSTDGALILVDDTGTAVPLTGVACHLTLTVSVRLGGDRRDVYAGLELGSGHPRAITKVLGPEKPTDEFALVWLDPTVPAAAGAPTPPPAVPSALLTQLLGLKDWTFLSGGSDGDAASAETIKGAAADPDDPKRAATGLDALLEIDDIAIVATPDSVRFVDIEQKTAVDNLIAHCEAPHAYRVGIVDPPPDRSISGVRAFRAQFDTTYAALYYPWVEIIDPNAKNDPSAAPAVLELPPSGLTAGIYARSDVERGVHKAPANEVILGITRFLQNVTYDRQAVLNPEGVNALRFFEGRANRIWGARTMSSDPEWRYVNVRRLFVYLEHSIDKSTQWAVFEPNNERLWANIRRTIEDFLLTVWRTGALLGTKPEEAFFVRCDRTTMTQNDLDNGRLICLIGVAPTYPAEFVIFRIGQWTADAPQG